MRNAAADRRDAQSRRDHQGPRLERGAAARRCLAGQQWTWDGVEFAMLHPVDANELFVVLPEQIVSALEMQGFKFYRWPLHAAGSGVTIRLVTSYATPSADVDEFIAAAAAIKPT